MRFDLDLSSKAIAVRDFSRKSGYFIEIVVLAIDKPVIVSHYRNVLSKNHNPTLGDWMGFSPAGDFLKNDV